MKMLIASLVALLVGATAKAETIELTTGNAIVFRGAVTEASTTKAQLELVALAKSRGKANYPIYLVLDSPGGSVFAGESFIEFAKMYENVHTITIFSASMAAGIVQSLPGKRYITKNGILMFHRASGRFQGQFETGEVESQLALWKQIVRGMEQRNADRLKLSLEDYKSKVVNEWWLYGADSVAQQGMDQIIDLKCSQQLIDKREMVTKNVLFFEIKAEFSGCPLFRSPLPSDKPETEEEE